MNGVVKSWFKYHMQVALSGNSFSLLQRIGAIVVGRSILISFRKKIKSGRFEFHLICHDFFSQRNGAKLFAVGTTSSLVIEIFIVEILMHKNLNLGLFVLII